jgi:hypothetical protein
MVFWRSTYLYINNNKNTQQQRQKYNGQQMLNGGRRNSGSKQILFLDYFGSLPVAVLVR